MMIKKRELDITLYDWEARYVLESISKEMERLKVIAEESSDEDEASDAGNDYLEISGLKERLEELVKNTFGNHF